MPYTLEPYEFSVKLKNNRFKYSITDVNEDNILFEDIISTSPINLGERSSVGKQINNFIRKTVLHSHFDKSQHEQELLVHNEFFECKKKLDSELKSSSRDVQSKIDAEKKAEYDSYLRGYSKLRTFCHEKGWTFLQLLAEITKGLGVGVTAEIMRSYFAFFQTACGVKGINVIIIGDPGQGKTWCMEGATNLITEDSIIFGTMTESAFYETYSGRDVTGLVFYLGDLGGGDVDDEKTIRFRNLLKILTTDGKVKDTINKEGLATPREVRGFPSLAYTSAKEEIINEQERSRSYIGYAPVADTRQIATFNALIKGEGKSRVTLDKITKISTQFRSVVFHFKDILDNYILFNPYLYDIEEFLRKDKNYNRKSNEFNELLRIVAVLSDPKIINLETHHETTYDKDRITEKHLLVASKQNNVDALMLLNNNNGLLTPEIDLANGLLQEFEHDDVFEQQELEDPTLYLEEMKQHIHEDNSFDKMYCFTVNDLRIRFKSKDWLLKNKGYLPQRLYRLAEEGLIIKIGSVKSTNENIYILSPQFFKPITLGVPLFKHGNFSLGLALFKEEYPELHDKLEQFLWDDFKTDVEDVSFNTGNSRLFNLLWESDSFNRVET